MYTFASIVTTAMLSDAAFGYGGSVILGVSLPSFVRDFYKGFYKGPFFWNFTDGTSFFFSLLMSCCVFPFCGELVKNSFRGWILLGIPLVTWDEF